MKYLQRIKIFKKSKDKDINDIINRPTDYRSLLSPGGYCSYKNGNIMSNENSPVNNFVIRGRGFEDDMFNYVGWKIENPNSILLKGMELFRDPNLFIVCPKVFLNDLIETCKNKDLDILFVRAIRHYNQFYFRVFVIENGFKESDSMPQDIYKYYLDHIKYDFDKKQKYYLSNYRFKDRNISDRFYSIVKEKNPYDYHKSIKDGIIKFEVNIKL